MRLLPPEVQHSTCHNQYAVAHLERSSPEAATEGPPGIAMDQLNGEAFEGVSLGNCIAYGLLELLVPGRYTHASFQLIGGQGRREEVAELIIPYCSETQVLGGEGGAYSWDNQSIVSRNKYRLEVERILICNYLVRTLLVTVTKTN